MSETNSNCFLFAGPTLSCALTHAEIKTGSLRLLPPVRYGDLERLAAAERSPGVLIIADGVFHQSLSLGHAEIREVLGRGWRVWGLASMGAIRAYEMRELGMRGYGRVYQSFFEHEDFRDDEVALIHELDPPYRALTEPLVHLRSWLHELTNAKLLDEQQVELVLARLMSLWFGSRTLALARELVLQLIPEHAAEIDLTLANFQRFHVKCRDLSDFLGAKVWRRDEN